MNKFVGNPMPAQCNYCRHFHFATEGPVSCAAFPDGIPDVILDNELDHRLEYPGDHGIRFAPRSQDKVAAFEELMGKTPDEQASRRRALRQAIDGP